MLARDAPGRVRRPNNSCADRACVRMTPYAVLNIKPVAAHALMIDLPCLDLQNLPNPRRQRHQSPSQTLQTPCGIPPTPQAKAPRSQNSIFLALKLAVCQPSNPPKPLKLSKCLFGTNPAGKTHQSPSPIPIAFSCRLPAVKPLRLFLCIFPFLLAIFPFLDFVLISTLLHVTTMTW